MYEFFLNPFLQSTEYTSKNLMVHISALTNFCAFVENMSKLRQKLLDLRAKVTA